MASSTKNLNAYIKTASQYMEAAGQLAGKPQKLSVVGDYLYWTQGKKQELFRASTTDPSATGSPVIVTKEETAAPPDGGNGSRPAAGEEKKLTKEEELLRERTRSLVTGISEYHVRASDNAVFFLSGLDLYVYYQEGPLAHKRPIKVFDFLSEADKKHFAERGGKPNMFIQFAAGAGAQKSDFSRVTFVNNNNVYLAQLTEDASNVVAPLSLQVTAITTIGDDQHQCGIADYIVQEEFDRYTGQYANAKYVVFSYTDMSMMRHVALLKGGNCGGADEDDEGVERMAYSRVGDPNARTTIVVYNIDSKRLAYIPPAALKNATRMSSVEFDPEYIPRFGFNGEDHLYLSLLSRTQEEMAVVSCPIASLPTISEDALKHIYDADTVAAASGDAAEPVFTLEWVQRIPWAWVDVMPGPPIYFGKRYDVLLCAAAETEGAHYHLYYRSKGQDASAWRALTAGAWNVRWGTVQVHNNDERSTVSFIANADGRLKYTLYVVPIPGTAADGGMTRLSRLGDHVYNSYRLHKDSVYYVVSNPRQPAHIVCSSSGGSQEAVRVISTEPWLRLSQQEGDSAPAETEAVAFKPGADGRSFTLFGCPMVTPSLVTVTNRRGVSLSAHLFPAAQETAAPSAPPRPLVLFVYGGPHVQLVNESDFDCGCRATVQAIAHQGMHVAIVDNQQATCNSLRELAICKKKMGHFETDDYCDMVKYLTGQCSNTSTDALPDGWHVDPTRVAIFGWSYGGYATLLAMSQAADVFKMGFAGAPVGDWKLYDTGYTERYMGLLYDNDDANGKAGAAKEREVSAQYNNSTIGNFVAGFPDGINRVFISHGLLDENVHFSHTAHVVEAMVAAGKPYSIWVYPGERHGLRQKKESRLHYEGMLLKTLVELL